MALIGIATAAIVGKVLFDFWRPLYSFAKWKLDKEHDPEVGQVWTYVSWNPVNESGDEWHTFTIKAVDEENVTYEDNWISDKPQILVVTHDEWAYKVKRQQAWLKSSRRTLADHYFEQTSNH